MSLKMSGGGGGGLQWVVNDTSEPIHASWNGKVYIWDPNPSTAPKGQEPKMFALVPERGEVDRGWFFRGNEKVVMKPGQGIKEGEKLVEVKPAAGSKVSPEYKHLCEAEFIRQMRDNNVFDKGGVKKLTFTDVMVDKYDALVSASLAKQAEVDSATKLAEERLKKLNAEIQIKLEQARQLEAGKK